MFYGCVLSWAAGGLDGALYGCCYHFYEPGLSKGVGMEVLDPMYNDGIKILQSTAG